VSKSLKIIFRMLIGAALVGVLIYKHELSWGAIRVNFAALSLSTCAAALGLYLFGQWISAWRWGMLAKMAGHGASYSVLWRSYFSGMFFNLCLPTSIGGDVLRTFGLGRAIQSRSAALASVFMDRNVGLAGLLLIGLVAAIVSQATLQATFGQTFVFPLWPLFILLVLGYATANALIFQKRFNQFTARLLRWPAERNLFGAGRWVEKLGRFHAALSAYRRSPQRYAGVFLISLVYQISEIGVVVLLARDLRIQANASVFAALLTFAAVASLLPITFNGMGVREFVFCAVLLGAAGGAAAEAEQAVKASALTLSLSYFGVLVAAGLCGGLIYLFGGLPKPTPEEIARWSKRADHVVESAAADSDAMKSLVATAER
jgi:hypothetical protein